MEARLLTKQQVIEKLKQTQGMGWIKSLRPLNSGGIGNTIDSLLGLSENNLPIANSAQWELKSHRVGSSSLLTLFHMEPEPREHKIVPRILLPKYGWPGRPGQVSFRQTLYATRATDRGFGIAVDHAGHRVVVWFDAAMVDSRHAEWVESVKTRAGLGPLSPQPYWPFQDLLLKASTKLLNSFYVEAEARRENGEEFFRIEQVLMLQNFEVDRFVLAIEQGDAAIEFDARTRKNHGAKFRLRQSWIPNLYRYTEKVL